MWQRFTEPARRVVFSAQVEAAWMGTNEIDTEHLLGGVLRDRESVAMVILEEGLAIPKRSIHQEISRGVRRDDGGSGQEVRLTARGTRVIDLAYEEAQSLGGKYIGTEHLLLGLAREEEGLAGQVLRSLGADAERLRQELRAMLEGKERLVQRVKNQFLQAVERDTGLPVRALVWAVMTRGPERVADEIMPFLALSAEDREALRSLPSPRERLEKLSALLETAAVSLRAANEAERGPSDSPPAGTT
jgi:ATP-dependent Clp protease ATP-binding subunit ClpA